MTCKCIHCFTHRKKRPVEHFVFGLEESLLWLVSKYCVPIASQYITVANQNCQLQRFISVQLSQSTTKMKSSCLDHYNTWFWLKVKVLMLVWDKTTVMCGSIFAWYKWNFDMDVYLVSKYLYDNFVLMLSGNPKYTGYQKKVYHTVELITCRNTTIF